MKEIEEMLVRRSRPYRAWPFPPYSHTRSSNGLSAFVEASGSPVIDLTSPWPKEEVTRLPDPSFNSSQPVRERGPRRGADELKVLLVEDSGADARLVREMLKDVWDFGFEIVHARRAADVRPSLAARPDIECALLDLSLPDAQGLSGLIDLRQAAPALPIVVLTGLDDEEIALQSLHQGAQDYLIKGQVDGDLLSRSIRYAIERKRLEIELAHEALHDPLTGLPNRRLFLDRVSSALARLERAPGVIGLLFVDLDRFKVVNDALGHDAGDELLTTVAHRLEEAVRPGDTVGRFGGDEFTVLCEGVSGERDTIAIAQRVSSSLSRPITIDGKSIEVTASVGIVVSSGKSSTPQALIRDADTAMYEAKEQGKARSVVFDRNLGQRASDRVALEADLEDALEHNRFELFYQPQIALKTGVLAGVEALLRWDHPSRGGVDPESFIAIAEDAGLMVPLGSWALREATRQASEWRKRGLVAPTMVAVNISPRQLADPNLAGLVRTGLRESGIDPERLCLEITERAVITDIPAATRVLNDLKALGVRLAIDDFGTGYASLVYVKRLPVDILKIDRSFVDGLGHDPEDSAIVTAVINLAHTLGLATVAEGVERPEQLSELRAFGCDVVQGTLFAPALPPSELMGMFPIESESPRWPEGSAGDGSH